MTKPSDNCTTPKEFFEVCNHLWGPFTIDVAANCQHDTVAQVSLNNQDRDDRCGDYCGECVCDPGTGYCLGYQASSNGLLHDWRDEVVWCNPPYSNPRPWVAKAPTAKRCVMLLKADTSTAWWRDAIALAGEVLFLKKRLVFGGYGGGKNTAKFPNVLVVWDPLYFVRRTGKPHITLSWDWEADLERFKR